VRSYLKKKPSQKRAGGVSQGEGTEFKPQYYKKQKKKKTNTKTKPSFIKHYLWDVFFN
jgi:hypothetical protein